MTDHRGASLLAESTLEAYILSVEFEWDSDKSEVNRRTRGFEFERAAEIFVGPTLEWQDDRRDYGEVRMRVLGVTQDELIHVVYTRRGAVVRIISARAANRKERRQWQSFARP